MTEDEKKAKERRILVGFGRKLVELRKARGWTTAELAKRSRLDLPLLQQYERGEVSATLLHMRMLAGVFGVPLSELVGFGDASTQETEHADSE